MKLDIIAKNLSPAFWLAVLFTVVMALLPKPPAVLLAGGDKIQHIVAFALLTVMAVVAYRDLRYRTIFVALATFGAFIEVLQMIPMLHRDAELADWTADCVTIAVVLFAFRMASWCRKFALA